VCVVCFFHSCSLCNWPLGCWVSTQIIYNSIIIIYCNWVCIRWQ
jgi:hypothetical protein